MVKSSRSSSRLLPIEDDDGVRWAAGLKSCAAICLRTADRMRKGVEDGNWQREVGMARLLDKVAGQLMPKPQRRPGKGPGGRRRLSDGQLRGVARVCA